MGILNAILNILFPIYCISCKAPGALLCTECVANFRMAERECAEWIFPLFDYRHPPIKKALQLFKYKGKKVVAVIFSEMLYGKIIEELSDLQVMENFREPLLIPIPLSPKRYRERGYNQAELLCKELTKIDQDHIFILKTDILIKSKETEHQARIKDRALRLKNLKDSYAVKNIELIKNKNIILIDDITTTGATLNEAKKILKKAGARKVIAFTVAH